MYDECKENKWKEMVCSADVGTYFCDIIAGVLHGDVLVPFLLIIYQDYVRRM